MTARAGAACAESARQLGLLESLEEAYLELRDSLAPGSPRWPVCATRFGACPELSFCWRVCCCWERTWRRRPATSQQQRYLRALAAPEALRAAEADTLVRECIYHGYLAGRMTTSDENDDSDEWNAVARQWLTLELFPEALVEYTLRALRASFYQYKRDGAAAAAAAVAGRMTTMRRRRKLK